MLHKLTFLTTFKRTRRAGPLPLIKLIKPNFKKLNVKDYSFGIQGILLSENMFLQFHTFVRETLSKYTGNIHSQRYDQW